MLIVLGIILYCIALAWCIIGVWYFCVSSIKLLLLMVNTGLPPNKAAYDQAMMLTFCSLSAYYLFFSRSISNAFHSLPMVKPIIIIGLFFFAGLSIVNYVVFHMTSSGHFEKTTLMITALYGIAIVRILMSFFFHKFPAEFWASR